MSEEGVNEINNRFVSDEIKGSFNNLDETIKKSNNINLNGDIILLDNEQEQFKDGIIIDKDVVIDGQSYKIDARKLVRIFKVQKKGKLTIKNITLTNGNSDYGGAISLDSDVSVGDNCIFKDNTTKWGGGAISSNTVIVSNKCSFSNNISKKGGGVIFSKIDDVTVGENCIFKDNTITEDNSGAIYSNNNTIVSNDCVFNDNISKKEGGAIFSKKHSVSVGKNCNFTKNKPNNYLYAL
jgi:predicted outer membrane repeat protein